MDVTPQRDRISPAQIGAPVTREFEQKSLLVAAMGDVPDLTGQKVTAGARHGVVP
jgi:hypothetical protein